MKRDDLLFNLGSLGYTLVSPEARNLKKTRVLELLEELVESEESRLVEGFPVVLAHCGFRGMNLDFKALLSRRRLSSPKQQDLEKLLLLSSDLLTQQGLDKPGNLEEVSRSLKFKYGDLLGHDVVSLNSNLSLSTERLQNTLERYTTDLLASKSSQKKEKNRQRRSFELNFHLSTLFAPKQKELVLKKYRGEPLNKTEQEYYSRTVKKKLEAMNHKEVKKVVAALTRK